MTVLSELKQRRHQLGSSRSIRRLLERRWWVVVLALMFTGLGAALAEGPRREQLELPRRQRA